ncbi:MAG: penicillin-binding protein transpeptidase [Gemmatimonadetes bacterium]|nr:penicillin-binding protein transpeptidase [Gemmatimonadota bacterium]
MNRTAKRILFLQGCFALALALVVLRAGQLQLVEGSYWSEQAESRRTARDTLEARRGSIYDRRGVQLAVTQEFYHVGIAPNEVVDRRVLVQAGTRALGVGAGELQRKLRAGKYLYFYGPYTATQIEPLRQLKGVHLEGSFRRDYPSSLAAPVIGRLPPDSSRGGSGLERALDGILTGTPGEAVFLRDRVGRRLESPARKISDPVPGNDVWLTLDAELQDIAERELEDAIRESSADGGDIVVLDPRTGELLAVASRQAGVDRAASSPTAFTSPFEPGSTAKLFTAAALLRLDKVDSTERVSGEGGHYMMPLSRGKPREINDAHKVDGSLTLADAIKVSSNIAMAKFSQRLSTVEQFEALRDFGFGSPTGVEFPSESRGQLKSPEQMIPDYSRASMAMGYEIGVTALQLAVAYAAIANDGVMVTPTLVREVRDPAGQLLYQHQPEPVRRVVPPGIAAKLQGYLRSVVEEGGGTGDEARLANYELAGKTGTARRFVGKRYEGYRASFAAFFPAKDPQLVVVVTIDNPTKGSYYGGQTAAPVTKRMLEQALASRYIAIDRARLGGTTAAVAAQLPAPAPRVDAVAAVTRVAWPYRKPDTTGAKSVATVPDVTGRGVRAAVLAVHQRGFRASVKGTGRAVRTDPAAGSAATAGTVVTIWTEE